MIDLERIRRAERALRFARWCLFFAFILGVAALAVVIGIALGW